MEENSARRAVRRLGAGLLVIGLAGCAPDLKTVEPTDGGASGGSGGMGGSSSASSGSGGEGGMGGSSVSSSASSSGAGGGMNAKCPSVQDTPSMVAVPSPGGKTYCIDSTEVTNKQYGAWLTTKPNPAEQDADCTWNTTFTTGMSLGADNLPVVNVDWCDAYAFCKDQGKRLCGNIETGGPNDFDSFADAAKSEWFNVCSKGGTLVFPYGNTYNPTICNGQDKNPAADQLEDVDSNISCQGGFPGAFNMSGNAWEWENSCEPASSPAPENQLCRRRGGSVFNDGPNLECDVAVVQSRSARTNSISFRCCADVLP